VLINEILTHTDPPLVDAIELFNPRAQPVDISGWFLSDDGTVPGKFRVPNGSTIPAGGYVVFSETNFNPIPPTLFNFSLDSAGDSLYLTSADLSGNLTGYSHGLSFGGAANGVSFGRYVNSVGEEQFPAQLGTTLGGTNCGPRVGPVVISEIMYHPDASGDKFIELRNITSQAVSLFDPAYSTNAWRISGLGFTLPTNTIIASNGFILVVATNPAVFRAKYSVPESVPVLGPLFGVLEDSGERLELQRPDVPDTSGVAYITVDEVRYNDKAPWPPGADGGGPSLQRRVPGEYGNDPMNWTAAVPTPGADFLADNDGDGMADDWERQFGFNTNNAADAFLDFDGDTMSNRDEYLAGTDPTQAASYLKFESLKIGGGATVIFSAVAAHSYSIEFTDAIGTGTWLLLTNIAPSPTNQTTQVFDSGFTAKRFYRIVTPSR
jgi:hypothetical protein